MITILKLRDLLAHLSKKGMGQVFADWRMLVGFTATSEVEAIQIGNNAEEAAEQIDAKHLVVKTQVEKGTGGLGPIYFALPNAFVVEALAGILEIPEDTRAAKASEGFTEEDLEAFQEIANLLCASWNRVLDDLGPDLRVSQSADHLKVLVGDADGGALGACVEEGRVAFVTLKVGCAGKEHTVLLLIPLEAAIGLAEEFYRTAA